MIWLSIASALASQIALASPFEPSIGAWRLPTEQATLEMLKSYGAAVLFLGHGSKGQYGDVDAVKSAVDAQVARLDGLYGRGQWVAMFGGDNFNAEKPDVAHVIKHLVDAHGVPTLAIQSDVVIPWGGVDPHLKYVHYVPTVKKAVVDEHGLPVIENGEAKMTVHWGGLIKHRPAGPTGFYLGDKMLGQKPSLLKEVIAIGGGPIGLEELDYAYMAGVPVTYIQARTRHPEVNGEFGSIERWAQQKTDYWGDFSCEPLFLNHPAK